MRSACILYSTYGFKSSLFDKQNMVVSLLITTQSVEPAGRLTISPLHARTLCLADAILVHRLERVQLTWSAIHVVYYYKSLFKDNMAHTTHKTVSDCRTDGLFSTWHTCFTFASVSLTKVITKTGQNSSYVSRCVTVWSDQVNLIAVKHPSQAAICCILSIYN